ncbi:peptidylprolyl isomerase [Flavobacterium sp. 14A]|uniref:peptidylprolyl isomerase n=1 Tax=Flavobacterium sp. 14A TaxID=2735896 RepID=UPI00156DD614|nr:peptidylprolyl isomerase [Flavobacterium sp. 14A]NRT11233.1 cyclophilin family peptidyl-prolyl cis-trans isomerase [Flavobacterium sp. 14A]
MKLRILGLVLFGIINLQAQTVKKASTTVTESTAVATPFSLKKTDGLYATISTNKGDIVVSLDYENAPVTTANFVSLAEGKNKFVTDQSLLKKPFYDGLKFHRVIKDFMIQTGDPQGTGSGGSGYSFKDEFGDAKFDKAGILAMANSGPATNSSQIFITHKETPWLNGKHTIFGHVVSGMDVVNAIAQDDVMNKVTITRTGKAAKKFKADKVFAYYFNNKEEDARKQAIIDEEKKQALIKIKEEKVAARKVMIVDKAAYFSTLKATATTTVSGFAYKIIKKGTAVKPVDGSTFYFHYAGYFADGNLFDSSYEEVNKDYGKFDERRAAGNGYRPIPFQAGRKDGMIPGFMEALSLMSYGDKMVAFIPANLAYGAKGAGDVIPANTDLIFELEMFEKQ